MKHLRPSFLFAALFSLGLFTNAFATEKARNLLGDAPAAATQQGAAGWALWTPRPALAVKGSIEQRDGVPTWTLSAERFESVGKWRKIVSGIEAGNYYRFDVRHRTEGVASDSTSVLVMLTWYKAADGSGELQRDYVMATAEENGWRRSARTLQAPPEAGAVRVELGLRWAPGGAVHWQDARLTEVPPPAERKVRIATTRILPDIPTATVEGNTELMLKQFDELAPGRPDVVLFSENLATRFVRAPLSERAQPVPGPLTNALAEKAKRYRTYVIATLLEANGDLFHNTAVLIDREGRLVGRYRKVHLTVGETESGLTPGSEFPVFETDFGRIGIMTCWDNWFSESARELRLAGAEILFLPLAGDGQPQHWEHVWRARAMDNGVWLVTSATVTDAPSRILNPQGKSVAETSSEFGHVLGEIDLNQEWRVRYLSVSSMGEPATFFIKERRPETY